MDMITQDEYAWYFILSASPHNFCEKWVGATNDYSNFDLRVKRVNFLCKEMWTYFLPYVSAFSMSINTPPCTVFTFCLAEGSSNFLKMSWVPSSACAPANWIHRINSSQDSNQAKKVGKSVVHRWHCGQETEDYTYIVGNTTCCVKCKIHFQHKILILLSYFVYYL